MEETPGRFTEDRINRLNQCAQSYAARTRALSCTEHTTYRDRTKTYDNIRTHDIDIVYHNHIARFTYFPHVPLTTAHSVLTCSVSLNTVDSQRLFHPLSQLYGLMALSPSNALTIPIITSDDSMMECFDSLAQALNEIDEHIRALSSDQERKAAFVQSEIDAAATFVRKKVPGDKDLRQPLADTRQKCYPLNNALRASIKEDDQKLLAFYYKHLLMRSLGTAYEAYLVGDYSTALKKIKKLNHRTPYENGLIREMEEAKQARPHVPDSILRNLTELYEYGIPKDNLKTSLAVIPAILLFGLIWLPVALGVYFLFYYLEYRDAVYLLGPLENAPSVILPAILMGIPMLHYKSSTFNKLFFRKNYEKLTELDNAQFSRKSHRFLNFLVVLLAVGSVVFLFLTVNQNIQLTESGFYDNSSNGTYYPYEDVDHIAYREQTPNGRGGVFPYPSYIIQMKDGTAVDPAHVNTDDVRFLEIFRDKGVPVEQSMPAIDSRE